MAHVPEIPSNSRFCMLALRAQRRCPRAAIVAETIRRRLAVFGCVNADRSLTDHVRRQVVFNYKRSLGGGSRRIAQMARNLSAPVQTSPISRLTTNGHVLSLRPQSKSYNADLVQAAGGAVKQWLQQPILLNGKPVEVARRSAGSVPLGLDRR